MPELEWPGQPEPASLRRALRHRLKRDVPSLRVVAECFLAEASPIDLLGVGPEGEWVSVRIAPLHEDATGLVQALADLEWLRARSADLAQLAPNLGLNPASDPRALLFCPDFGAESQAAARPLSKRTIELLRYRCFQQSGQLALVLDRVHAPPRPPATVPEPMRSPPPAQAPSPRARRRESEARSEPLEAQRVPRAIPAPRRPQHDLGLSSPSSPSRFRTGLRDVDLLRERATEPQPLGGTAED